MHGFQEITVNFGSDELRRNDVMYGAKSKVRRLSIIIIIGAEESEPLFSDDEGDEKFGSRHCYDLAKVHQGIDMASSRERLEAALAATELRTPRIPVISNVDAQPHSDPETIKKILARQVTSPVQWETTVKTLLTKGLNKSYELGPGKVIAGIVKRVNKGADIENIAA
nr:Polyketide-type polyunsaturated fatty acid synthase [Ipomoea batatas]